jgi:hypothetical protein
MGQEISKESKDYDLSFNIGNLKFEEKTNWEIECKEINQKIKLLDEYQKEKEISENYLLSEIEHKFGFNKYLIKF